MMGRRQYKLPGALTVLGAENWDNLFPVEAEYSNFFYKQNL
jgi:hypothetical protein